MEKEMKKQNDVEETKRVYNGIHEYIKDKKNLHVLGALPLVVAESLIEFCKQNHKYNKLTEDKFFEETLCGINEQIVLAYHDLKNEKH